MTDTSGADDTATDDTAAAAAAADDKAAAGDTGADDKAGDDKAAADDKAGDDKDAGDDKAAADGGDEETKVLLSGDEDDGAGEEGVPDEYTFVSPDDIGEIEMTDEVKAQFADFQERAKDAELTQAQYQKLVEGEIKRGDRIVQKMTADYHKRIKGWADATRADKEIGGDDLKENLSVAKLGLERIATKELRALLAAPSEKNPEGLGLGSHPEFLRLFHRVGKMKMEDGDIITGDGSGVESDASLRRMYPTMFTDDKAA